jgi:UDPglucose 6-dehydrogenase
MKLSVIGLGRLGLVWALVADAAGHDVRGMDVDRRRVDAINGRRVDTREPGLAQLLGDPRCGLIATTDPAEALAGSELSVVIVPTPSEADGSFGLGPVLAAIEAIGTHARRLAPRHVVVLKSTVSPGATAGPVRSALAAAAGPDSDLGLVYAPEFHAIGSIVRDITNPYLLILGGDELWALSRAEELHRSLMNGTTPAAVLDATGAELAKLASNSFRTMKIAFANSLAALAAAHGSDAHAVCAAVGADPHIGPGYLRPGPPYGGPCYPRDNPALRAAASAVGLAAPLAEAAESANDARFRELERIGLAATAGPIGIIGPGFKPGADELEGSPALELARRWRAAGREVVVHDPPGAGSSSSKPGSLAALLDACSAVLLATPDPPLVAEVQVELIRRRRRPAIIDPWGALREAVEPAERSPRLSRDGAC